MKYIRTKDRIYESADHYTSKEWIEANGGVLVKSNKNKNRDIFLKDYEITKQADTIEELCDEFVYLFKGRHFYCRWNELIKKWQTLPEFFEMSDDKIKTIKGAIWTDKGLIYKARMKGILPNGEIDWELL